MTWRAVPAEVGVARLWEVASHIICSALSKLCRVAKTPGDGPGGAARGVHPHTGRGRLEASCRAGRATFWTTVGHRHPALEANPSPRHAGRFVNRSHPKSQSPSEQVYA